MANRGLYQKCQTDASLLLILMSFRCFESFEENLDYIFDLSLEERTQIEVTSASKYPEKISEIGSQFFLRKY